MDARRHNQSGIPARVARFAEENGLFPKDGRIVCAVSGGPDSVALLHILLGLRERFQIDIGVCHIEHGIRGDFSVADMEFVQKLCTDWDVPLEIFRLNPQIYGNSGTETAARGARRAIFRELLQTGATRIALGHHRDDQAETALMRLARGARGPIGMRAETNGIIRPLLPLSREEIEKYLTENSLAFRLDETNTIADNPRNRIRLSILPELEKEYPGASRAIARAAEYARADDDFMLSLAREWLQGDQAELPAEPVLRRVIAVQARSIDLDGELTQALIGRVMALYRDGRTGKRVFLKDAFWEKTKAGKVIFSRKPNSPAEMESMLEIPGTTMLCGHSFRAEILDDWQGAYPDGSAAQLFDADLLPPLAARFRRPGDRMRPLGMTGHKKLQDILTDRGVPKALRDVCPLLARGKDIYWMPGLPPSETARVSTHTKRYIYIKYMGRNIDESSYGEV